MQRRSMAELKLHSSFLPEDPKKGGLAAWKNIDLET